MDPSTILSGLVVLAGVLVLILYRGVEKRLTTLEGSYVAKEHAEEHRRTSREDLEEHALHDEKQHGSIESQLRDFRSEWREAFLTLRTEANEKRGEVRADLLGYRAETNARFDATNLKIDGLVNQISAMALLQVRSRGRQEK